MNIERRQSVRVRFPRADFGLYPRFEVEGQPLRLDNLSTGGCCLLDPRGIMGPRVGNNANLSMICKDGPFAVDVRIVASVDQRRHLQFLNLPPQRVKEIQDLLTPGVRGLALRPLKPEKGAPGLAARELWTSLASDSIVFEIDIHRMATVNLEGRSFTVMKNAWPMDERGRSLERSDVERISLFLCNIPAPSPALVELLTHIERLMLAGVQP